MKFIYLFAAISLFVSFESKAACFNMDRSSNAYQTCMLRAENALRDVKLERESKKRDRDEARDRLYKRIDDISQKRKEEREKALRLIEEDTSRPEGSLSDEDKQKLADSLSIMMEGMSMLIEPYTMRVKELIKQGKCLEAHNLINSGAKGRDTLATNAADNMHGGVSDQCEHDKAKAFTYYSRAAKNGSVLAKVALETLIESSGKSEVAIKAVPEKCKVIDIDIGTSYTGGCKDGLAHWNGVAKGRDEYRGNFLKGYVDGEGVYIWGATSEWAGERYEGAYRKGAKHGFGVSSIGVNASNKGVVSTYKEAGILEKNRYVRRGYFEEGKFVFPCKTRDSCLTILAKKKTEEKLGY
jgi:hypothetical protein